MKSLGKLSETLDVWIKKKEQELMSTQREVAKKILEDVVEEAPIRTSNYISSIRISETEKENNIIKTMIYSDLLVGGSNPKWAKVPLGALLEWGTGIEGASSNTYPHGYDYRLTPWCYYDEELNQWITTTGMIARPHFYPALLKNKETYLKEIRKVLRNGRY